jgi:hypothetical protein
MMNKKPMRKRMQQNHAEANITFFSGGEPSGRPSKLPASTLRLTPTFDLGDGDSALANRGGVARNDGASGVPERLLANP